MTRREVLKKIEGHYQDCDCLHCRKGGTIDQALSDLAQIEQSERDAMVKSLPSKKEIKAYTPRDPDREYNYLHDIASKIIAEKDKEIAELKDTFAKYGGQKILDEIKAKDTEIAELRKENLRGINYYTKKALQALKPKQSERLSAEEIVEIITTTKWFPNCHELAQAIYEAQERKREVEG